MRYAIIIVVVALIGGCNFARKQVENRDEGALTINREVRITAVNGDTVLVVEVLTDGSITQDEGGTGDHKELKLDPSKLKTK